MKPRSITDELPSSVTSPVTLAEVYEVETVSYIFTVGSVLFLQAKKHKANAAKVKAFNIVVLVLISIEVLDYLRRPLSKMERDKMKNGEQLYPYYGAAEIMDYIDSYLFDGEYILMGEDGTVKTDDGYPILQYATGKFWPNNHAHVLQAKSPYNNCFIWNYLKTTNIESIVTGAVQPKINQANLLSLPFYKYPIKLVEMYMRITDDWWSKIMMNNKQIQTLIQTRDGLLPRLMGGEVKL